MTPPEARLWVALRSLRPAGFHFRRQVPFRGYFLDFACHAGKLAVEVDGGAQDNAERLAHDGMRDATLAREGYHTLRFKNEDVRDNSEGVVLAIREALADPIRRFAPPSP